MSAAPSAAARSTRGVQRARLSRGAPLREVAWMAATDSFCGRRGIAAVEWHSRDALAREITKRCIDGRRRASASRHWRLFRTPHATAPMQRKGAPATRRRCSPNDPRFQDPRASVHDKRSSTIAQKLSRARCGTIGQRGRDPGSFFLRPDARHLRAQAVTSSASPRASRNRAALPRVRRDGDATSWADRAVHVVRPRLQRAADGVEDWGAGSDRAGWQQRTRPCRSRLIAVSVATRWLHSSKRPTGSGCGFPLGHSM